MIDSNFNNVILYDGFCNLCNSTANFVKKKDQKKKFRFESLHSEFAKVFFENVLQKPPGNELTSEISKNYFETIVLINGDQIFLKSKAILKIAQALGFPYSLIYIFILVPSPVRDFIYDVISRNRYKWFGKSNQCSLP